MQVSERRHTRHQGGRDVDRGPERPRPIDVDRRPERARVRSPFGDAHRIRAVLFDLDGTLYNQRPMRLLMLGELATLPLRSPFRAVRVWRGIKAYRRAQEALREQVGVAATRQLELASDACGIPRDELADIVGEWMVRRPLKHLPWCRVHRLVDLLEFLKAAGVELGVLSDYPAAPKLRALGIFEYFSVVLCATDPNVGVFKPHPRGFLAACERWGLKPADVLVVGDRLDADAAGATAAGMRSVVIGSAASPDDVVVVPSIERLHRVLANDHDR